MNPFKQGINRKQKTEAYVCPVCDEPRKTAQAMVECEKSHKQEKDLNPNTPDPIEDTPTVVEKKPRTITNKELEEMAKNKKRNFPYANGQRDTVEVKESDL